MLSVLVSIRNSRDRAFNLLRTMLRVFASWPVGTVEFIIVDDNSEQAQEIPSLIGEFRGQLAAGVKCIEMLFTQHQHYTRALAYGISAAKGSHVLFVSHDMLLTPDYVRVLMSVAATDAKIGLVRGTSPYVDCFPEHTIMAAFPFRDLTDIELFSRYVADYYGLQHVDDRLLTGDSMLITRAALDKIGTFDPRYFGYFGDIDFGLRIQRAGLRMVCAKGAWLYHEGAAAYKDKAEKTQQEYAAIHQARMKVVNDAYHAFRDKWDKSLAPDYTRSVDVIPFEALRKVPPPQNGEFQPFMTPPADICTIR
jgi:GT2 family glycosyltransferase